jgi:Hsp90 protein
MLRASPVLHAAVIAAAVAALSNRTGPPSAAQDWHTTGHAVLCQPLKCPTLYVLTSWICRITLYVKEDAEDMLEEASLSRLIKQYSEFISFPIKLWTKSKVPKQVEDTEATKKAQEFADKKAAEKGEVWQPLWWSRCSGALHPLFASVLGLLHLRIAGVKLAVNAGSSREGGACHEDRIR